MIKFLQSFMPFVMGIDISMFDLTVQYLEENENIYLVFIEEQRIDISNNIIKNQLSQYQKKNTKKIDNRDVVNLLPKFPKENYNHLFNNLERIKKEKSFTQDDEHNLIQELFIKNSIYMFGDYTKYLSFIDETPLFNKESFLESKLSENRDFYDEFTEVQMFNQLVQNQKMEENFPYFYNESLFFIEYQNMALTGSQESKTIMYSMNNYLEASRQSRSRTSIISESTDFKTNKMRKDSSCMSISEEKNELYVLKPYFLEEFKNTNDRNKFEEIIKNKYVNFGHKGLILKDDYLLSRSAVTEINYDIEYDFYKYSYSEYNIEDIQEKEMILRKPRYRKSTVVRFNE